MGKEMSKEMGVPKVGLVLCLVLGMTLKPVWVQAQEQAQEAAQKAGQEATQAVALTAAEDAKPEPGPEQPSAQESAESAQQAELAELTEPAELAELAEPAEPSGQAGPAGPAGPAKPAEPAGPTEPAQSVPLAKTMTLALAEQILDAARAQARAEGWRMSLAVMDAAGNLVAMIRMDGARWMTAQVAQAKAFTAVTFRRSSAAVEELAEQRPDLFKSLVTLIDRPLLLAGGGLPVIINGELLGSVGASGGTEDQDIDCAEAGLNAIGEE